MAKQLDVVRIPGEGIGPAVMAAACQMVDHAVRCAYHGDRSINWREILISTDAPNWRDQVDDAVNQIKKYRRGVKGPLNTPSGGGIRSLNVLLRSLLNLYACVRPSVYYEGIVSPLKHPEKVHTIIFRENTEDLYKGIEFAPGTKEVKALQKALVSLGVSKELIAYSDDMGIGIKPISRESTERIMRAALVYAIENKISSITIVAKSNIMKFTEGKFRDWCFEFAQQFCGGKIFTSLQYEHIKKEQGVEAANTAYTQEVEKQGKIYVQSLITDNAFQQMLLRPERHPLIVTMNLNGDYLSDAVAAMVGGLGMSNGVNINYETGLALYEATHGTAPDIAGLDIANPFALTLSLEMMLRQEGWNEAADLLNRAIRESITSGNVTGDLGREMAIPQEDWLKTSELTEYVCASIADMCSVT